MGQHLFYQLNSSAVIKIRDNYHQEQFETKKINGLYGI